MNKIKKQLKKESRSFVPNIKDKLFINLGIEDKYVNNKFNFKPYLLLVSTVIIIVLSLYFLISQEINKFSNTIITININPAIELEINKDDEVVNLRPLNYEAIILLENKQKLINKNVLEVVDLLLEQASNTGYLVNNRKVTINVINENEKRENRVREKMLVHYQNKKNINILTNEEFKEKAREYKISVGKMKLVDELMKKDPSMTIDKARKLSIKEINERIGNYKKDIKEYEEKFQKRLSNFYIEKKQASNSYLKNYHNALRDLEKFKKYRNNQQIKIQLEMFINKYLSSLEINKDKELKEILDELKSELDKQKDYINELIENHYNTQINYYKEIIKKEGKDKISNYQFTDFSLIYEVSNKYLNDHEKDLIVLVDGLNIYLNHINQKTNLDSNSLSNAKEVIIIINEMLNSSNIRNEIKNNRFIENLYDKFNDLLTK